MCFDDLIGDGQSKAEMVLPASGLFHPIETVEDLLLIFVRDADAVILHLYGEVIACVGKRKSDPAVLWGIADGIVEQDCDDLADPFGVSGA